jgi:hypothetical protein
MKLPLIASNASILANILEITERRVNQLVGEGVLERIDGGKFDTIESMKRYYKYQLTKYQNGNPTEEELLKERTLHEQAKRKKTELELMALEGSLHPEDRIKDEVGEMIVNCKSKLRVVAVKVAAKYNPKMTLAEITDLISKEVDEALMELSDYDRFKLIEGDGDGQDL